VVADQCGKLGKAQPLRAMAAGEPADQAIDLDEIAQDLEDPRGATHGVQYMGRARAAGAMRNLTARLAPALGAWTAPVAFSTVMFHRNRNRVLPTRIP